MHKLFLVLVTMGVVWDICAAQQVSIARIDAMPNHPAPYIMRDWKRVAQQYDSLVFDQTKTGRYLPLVALTSTGFGLSSYVGELPSDKKEAINCIPAVVGATLVGIDKTSQFSTNWVDRCQSWFNASSAESVYLNSPGGTSGGDWWYDLMPNVFFYQLYSLYPNVGNFKTQFTTVADRWWQALQAMGAGRAPWSIANLHHTAWNLSTMKPTDLDFFEPEAGGSIAWLLYNAYAKTGHEEYRIGAELALESLSAYPSTDIKNPSYELQLPYGAYIAARMNAEIGTTYDIGKLVGWCFSDGSDNSRLWGVTVGSWGGYDCDGLIGETGFSSGNGYPFTMNSFEQVGALVPLVRYDARFARAIGKYVLNAANAARLFYTQYLPDANQDSASWSHLYDPQSVIAHESMHQFKPGTTVSPYATGDAIGNGNSTNFGLYGSSHVGIFGGIIDTTNVPMILRLDVLKTDYFHGPAYPTYLYFNPDSVERSVDVDAGSGQHDLYDAANHAFILQNVTGHVSMPISANSAILLVDAPHGTVTYNYDEMLIDSVVVDFHSGTWSGNYPPRIKSLAAPTNVVTTGHSVYVYCAAQDRDGDTLAFIWSATGGTITGSASTILWTAPDSVGTYVVRCTAGDGHGGQTSSDDTITVVQFINQVPVIEELKASPRKLGLGASSALTCRAYDPDSAVLTYTWKASAGTLTGTGAEVAWQAPRSSGDYTVSCTVDDGQGGVVSDSTTFEVRDLSNWPTGSLVAYYPFDGNANDASGNGHNGTVNNAQLVPDRFGNANSAYYFNGTTASIVIPNDSALNFQNGITLDFWMSPHAFSAFDLYVVSHGSYQNRWKVSVTSQRIRWTIKTSTGVLDLDSQTQLVLDSLYNVCVTYNGSDVEIYINGNLDSFTGWTGLLATANYDLTIGQDFSGNNKYDFNGTLDEVRLYNYMLPPDQIASFYDINTSVAESRGSLVPSDPLLEQNYPNPFNPATTIRFSIPARLVRSNVRLDVFDILGRKVDTLINGILAPGDHSVVWDGAGVSSGVYYSRLTTALGTQTRKMILIK